MNYDKFIWKEGDIEFIDEKEFTEKGVSYGTAFRKKFDTCVDNKECPLCDDDDMKIADPNLPFKFIIGVVSWIESSPPDTGS